MAKAEKPPRVSTCLLFDKDAKLLIYLRDDKPSISFPNHWDLFGGFIEKGESPEEALTREIEEELGVTVGITHKFRDYHSLVGQEVSNIKHVYWARIAVPWSTLTLREGQQLMGIDLTQRRQYRFANILATIIDDFCSAGIKV